MINTEKKTIFLIFSLSFLYVLPILISNNLFADDLWRVWSGYPGFMENGRFMSEALMFLMSTGYGVFDFFPIPQIIASFLYWWSGYALSKHLSPHKDEIWHVLIGSSFLISPFTIAQISFRFDSITMALSVLSATYSFLLYKDKAKNYLLSLILIIISLGFYQPSITLTICLPFIGIAISRDRISLITFITKVSRFIFITFSGFLIYSKLILRIIPTGQYTADHAGIVPISKDSIPIIIDSFYSINSIFYDLISSSEGYVFLVILVIPFIFLFLFSMKKWDGLTSLAIKITSILAIICTLYFPASLLKSPVVEPRVISSGCLLIFLCITSLSHIWKYKIGLVITYILILHFFMMMSIYSNTLNQADNENKNFNNSLSFTLIKSGWKDGDVLYFSGRLKHTPPVSRFLERFPFYKRVIQYYYVDSYMLGYSYSQINGLNVSREGEYYMPEIELPWKMIGSNNYGNLYSNENKFVFKFTE